MLITSIADIKLEKQAYFLCFFFLIVDLSVLHDALHIVFMSHDIINEIHV